MTHFCTSWPDRMGQSLGGIQIAIRYTSCIQEAIEGESIRTSRHESELVTGCATDHGDGEGGIFKVNNALQEEGGIT